MLLSLAATSALAKEKGCQQDGDYQGNNQGYCVRAAPEIDPAQGLSALMLLAGTVAIFRASRARKK